MRERQARGTKAEGRECVARPFLAAAQSPAAVGRALLLRVRHWRLYFRERIRLVDLRFERLPAGEVC